MYAKRVEVLKKMWYTIKRYAMQSETNVYKYFD